MVTWLILLIWLKLIELEDCVFSWLVLCFCLFNLWRRSSSKIFNWNLFTVHLHVLMNLFELEEERKIDDSFSLSHYTFQGLPVSHTAAAKPRCDAAHQDVLSRAVDILIYSDFSQQWKSKSEVLRTQVESIDMKLLKYFVLPVKGGHLMIVFSSKSTILLVLLLLRDVLLFQYHLTRCSTIIP